MYVSDEYFSYIYASYGHKAQDGFYIAKGYLFKEGRLCIPQGSIRKLLVKESHEGGLMGHFGIDKTLVLLKEKFFWPHMKKHAHRYCIRCVACFTFHHNAVVSDPPTNETKSHMKPLNLTAMVED